MAVKTTTTTTSKVQAIGTTQASSRYLKGRFLDVTGTTSIRDLLWSFAIIRKDGHYTNADLRFSIKNLKSALVQKPATVKPCDYIAVASDSDAEILKRADEIRTRLKDKATNVARARVSGEMVQRWTVEAEVEGL